MEKGEYVNLPMMTLEPDGHFCNFKRYYVLEKIFGGNEDKIDTKTMLRRANGKGYNAGSTDAKDMLEKQESIPTEWREFVLVFLSGTYKLTDVFKCTYVAGLEWKDGRWRYVHMRIDSCFSYIDRSAIAVRQLNRREVKNLPDP